jgi:hypothetical protein
MMFYLSVLLSHLFHYEDAVVKLLPMQDTMHVVQEDSQVLLAISERHNDGHPLSGLTHARPPYSPHHDVTVVLLFMIYDWRLSKQMRHIQTSFCTAQAEHLLFNKNYVG